MSKSNAYIAHRSNKRNSPFLPLKSAKIWRYLINFAQMFLYSRSKPTKKLLEWGPILNIQLHQIFHFLCFLYGYIFSKYTNTFWVSTTSEFTSSITRSKIWTILWFLNFHFLQLFWFSFTRLAENWHKQDYAIVLTKILQPSQCAIIWNYYLVYSEKIIK